MHVFQRVRERRVQSHSAIKVSVILPLEGGWGQDKEAQVGPRIGTGDRNKNGELEHQGLGAKINEAEKAKAGVGVCA